MQTFLPYPDFRQSAAALDTARLGKQRVEALHILRALVIPEYSWLAHPAVRMWMGNIPALTLYGLAMVDEWTSRGHPDNTRENITEFAPQAAHPDYASKIAMPKWLGDPDFHLAHRSNLLRKEPKFYGSAFPGIAADLGYVWPEPKIEVVPSDPQEDRLWILRAAVKDPNPKNLGVVSLPPLRRAGAPANEDADGYTPVFAEDGSRRPSLTPRKLQPKMLVKKPTRKRQQQEQAFITLPGNTMVAVPYDDGKIFALGKVLGRPITYEGRFAREFEVTEILDRSAFDYPALLQDPRVFFPVPAH